MVWNFQIPGCRAVQSFARDLPFALLPFPHPITSSHHPSPSPLDELPPSKLPPKSRKRHRLIRALFTGCEQISRFPGQSLFRYKSCISAYIKVCGRGEVYLRGETDRRIGDNDTSSTGIGRDVARLNS